MIALGVVRLELDSDPTDGVYVFVNQLRNALLEHLPVHEVTIEPEDDVSGLKKIGEEITETLEYTPASLIELRTIRPKYAKSAEDGVMLLLVAAQAI